LTQLTELQDLAKTSTTALREISAKFKKDLGQLTEAQGKENEDKIAALITESLKVMCTFPLPLSLPSLAFP